LLIATVLAPSGCCNLGADDHTSGAPAPGSASPPVGSVRPSEAPSGELAPGEPAPAAVPERQIAGAAHILFAYKGADRAPKTVTRTKDQAKKRADEALAKLKDGKATFEEFVTQLSDDDISKQANGMIGNFERNAMPAAFADATFNLKVGDVSDVVETPQGFHIIKRTK
jgi:hypothetical protein